MGATELASRRVVALATAVLAVLIVIVVPLVILRPADRTLPGWYAGIVLGVVGIIVAWGLLAPWLSARGLRIGASIGVAGYVVFVAAFPPAAFAVGGVGRIPWMLSTMGVAAAVALLAGGPLLATATIVFGAGSALLYRLMFGGLDLDGLVNDTQSVLSAVVVCTLGAFLFSVSRGLDHAKETAAAEAALAAAERGRLSARTRAAALVHDEVLATLTLAASDLPIPRDALARQSARATRLLSEVERENAATAEPLRIALARIAREYGARFWASVEEETEPTPVAAEALLAATRQALDNSVRHAGDGTVQRGVRLRAGATEIEVEVVDDGRGFDLGGVAADRLGVTTSILRRMRDVPGGDADVVSAPGLGTRVALRWERPVAAEPDIASRSPRTAIVVIAAVFVIGQGLAALAAGITSSSWLPPVVLVLLLLFGEALRRAARPRLSARNAWIIGLATALVVLVATWIVPYTFGDLWFVGAAAFLFVGLALLGRPAVAVTAQLAVAVGIVVLAIVQDGPVDTIGHVLTRPLLMVGLAVILHVVVGRMRRRAGALHSAAVVESGRRAWDAAARAELAARGARLRAQVLPLLDRLDGTGPLTDGDRRARLRIEGELRDEVRAGVLAREPLVSAARAARERGVDVVLLDDSDGTASDAVTDDIARWMAPLVDAAGQSVVGRALPPGRPALATLTADGETTHFRGRPTSIA
ncbi:ATP-binding protein [Microbacterium sp. X-17]|uniref:ATP-binding protein n=1 Tax=Microbacterium sp. X-17 TaxID=3144404 RepID=UPI0031F514E1